LGILKYADKSAILQRIIMNSQNHLNTFDASLSRSNLYPLAATGITIFQVNVGRLCNQLCKHCHVNAGPDRKEIMQKNTMEACLDIIEKTDIPTIDITGGAPEMNPNFRWFVKEFRKRGRHVMVRSNLTILTEPDYKNLPEFFAENKAEVIASFPHYLEQTLDRQRGNGVFKKSIEALKQLNSIGYGKQDSGLVLNLVYNPAGAFLPPSQKALEADYKREMSKRYGIVFNNLFTIANMPIGRFLNYLRASQNHDAYMQKLTSNYNPDAASQVMCRYTLSVGWDGSLYDCDFNQMLGMKVNHGAPSNIKAFDITRLCNRQIVTGIHCYGCTAGGGSSCGGAVV
jgi:radical SAM/Cys-rich protein